jgi:hypothetical protein
MGKEQFETFDSGSGPVIPKDVSMAHEDDGQGGVDVVQGAVPEVPQSK